MNLSIFAKVLKVSKVKGGTGWSSINRYSMEDGKDLFVKASSEAYSKDMFRGEAIGLSALYGNWVEAVEFFTIVVCLSSS